MTTPLQLTAADGFSFPAYVARPQGAAHGAIVVLQEIFGVNAHIRAVADSYAAQGYVAIAPATFHRVQADVDLGYTPQDIAAGVALKAAVEALPAPGVLQDIAASVAYAAQFGAVGVVGYCWGGLLAWRAACTLGGIAAAVPYYGGGMTSAAEAARQPRCPVLAHFGDQDHAIALDSVLAFQKAQTGVQVQIYPAQHGFNCDHRAAFNPAAAALARERTLSFFAQHLR
ncbi:MAG: dienelactone hydrolase family protein [Burkholderiaceae bacterium]|nr:dienelactone hydrolase family protein [Burkholderiaceae bacterium]